jgi:hypothetical protein
VSVRRVGAVTNFSASAEVKAAFETVTASVATMGFDMLEVRVPFEAVSLT